MRQCSWRVRKTVLFQRVQTDSGRRARGGVPGEGREAMLNLFVTSAWFTATRVAPVSKSKVQSRGTTISRSYSIEFPWARSSLPLVLPACVRRREDFLRKGQQKISRYCVRRCVCFVCTSRTNTLATAPVIQDGHLKRSHLWVSWNVHSALFRPNIPDTKRVFKHISLFRNSFTVLLRIVFVRLVFA